MNKNLENNYDIFRFLDMKSNTIISLLNKNDLEQLLYYLEKYYLELRKNINIEKDITFGIEIETENINRKDLINNFYKHNILYYKSNNICGYNLEKHYEKKQEKINNWYLCDDKSLTNGIELVSPIFTDKEDAWIDIEEKCLELKKYSEIGINSGGHIHIGANALKNSGKSLINLLLLWSTYENIIYRFSYGEYLYNRISVPLCANLSRNKFWRIYKTYEKKVYKNDKVPPKMIIELSNNRYQTINFSNMKFTEEARLHEYGNTIEFRCANGTLNPIIWQNNINLFTKMIEYSNKYNYDKEKIVKRRKDEILVDTFIYKNIFLTQAIEFVDLIFNNNLDKIYFLRQYLKSFEEKDSYEKAKKFTI